MSPAPTLLLSARLVRLSALLAAGAWGLTAFGQDGSIYSTPTPEITRAPRMSERVPIFFPPTPPPLGRALPKGVVPTGPFVPAPEMAEHVNEPYYPQLATQLATKSLSRRQRTQVEEYRTRKRALQSDLRSELDRTQALPPDERTKALVEFSRKQAAELAALEAAAEQLRRDLVLGDQTWGASRQWRLNDHERRAFSPFEISQVMRAYAYYQNGLLPAQRRLLREIALELQSAGESADAATANQPYLFFPPEPARVLIPDDIPASVAAQLAVYQSRKSALKKELYDAIYAHDGQSLPFLRGNTMKALADRQAGPIAELEKLAEEIRLGLAAMPEAVPLAERTPLPPVLHQRVATLLRDVNTAQQAAITKIESIFSEAQDLPIQTRYRFETEGLKVFVVPLRVDRRGQAVAPEVTTRINAIRAQATAVADDYGRQLAGFLNERDAIRSEVGQTLNLAKADRIDQALGTAMRVATARETQDLYREYRVALFQPGLSPEQRRLLFDHVIERLELPLPRGELQPTMRSATW